jgi:16S rRNA (adenine1518-N6/adenine1519-N6)-dimethyltransferase
MVDDSLLDEIVGYAELRPGDVVLEVGAGTGRLTERIAERVKLSAIEKDSDLFKLLRKKFAGDGWVELIHGDALKVEFPLYNKIISNIPYSVSRKLTERFILEGFDLAVLVVQSEFAEKLNAQHRSENYRMISVLAQSTCGVEVLREVPPQAFKPQPKVSSVVVKLKQNWRPPKEYITFLNRLFSLKNKKIKNIIDAPAEYREKRPVEMTPQEIRELYGNI